MPFEVLTELMPDAELEQMLRETEQQYRAVVKSVPGGIYRCKLGSVWDLEFLGEGIEEITGYPACGLDNLFDRISSAVALR